MMVSVRPTYDNSWGGHADDPSAQIRAISTAVKYSNRPAQKAPHGTALPLLTSHAPGPDRIADLWGSRGRRFKSGRPDKICQAEGSFLRLGKLPFDRLTVI